MAFVSISGIALAGHSFGRFYPWVITIFFLSMSVLLLFALRGYPLPGVVGGAIIVGVFYRLYFNLHVPTPVGMSNQHYPERYDTIIVTGELLGGYYSSPAGAPFQDLLFSSFPLIAGIGAYYSLFLYPILIGVLYPLFAIGITRNVGITDHRILSIVAVLTLVTTEGLRRAYWSRNQVIATFFWLAAIYVLVKYLKSPNTRLFTLLAAFAASMAFSHRLPLAIFTVILVGLGILSYADRIAWRTVTGVGPTKQILSLVVFIGSLTTVQLIYLGGVIDHLVARVFRLHSQLFDRDGVQSVPDQIEPSAANEVLPGIIANIYEYPSVLTLFVERGHGVWIALIAGIAWVYLYFWGRDLRTRHRILALLSVSAVGVAVMFIGFVSVSAMNPTRPLQLVEPILVVILAIVVWRLSLLDRSRLYRIGLAVVLVLFISSQVFAMAAGPDYANSPRFYADVPESAAKTTICEYSTGDVYADFEMTFYRDLNQENCEMNSFGTGPESSLFNANISPENHPTVIHRNNVGVYHGTGGNQYELTWSPEAELPQEYHTVYDNGDVVMYSS